MSASSSAPRRDRIAGEPTTEPIILTPHACAHARSCPHARLAPLLYIHALPVGFGEAGCGAPKDWQIRSTGSTPHLTVVVCVICVRPYDGARGSKSTHPRALCLYTQNISYDLAFSGSQHPVTSRYYIPSSRTGPYRRMIVPGSQPGLNLTGTMTVIHCWLSVVDTAPQHRTLC